MHRVKGRDVIRAYGAAIAALVAIIAFVSSGSCFFDTKTTLCEASGRRCQPGQVCAAYQDACINIGGCGDNIRSTDELCDDGNIRDGDGCSADCTSDEACGNRIIDLPTGEFCDDGNTKPGDGCSEKCTLEECGDLVVNVARGEECDTGPGDSLGCDADCTFSKCGDGHWNEATEDCEVADGNDTATCNGDCTLARCGDKHTNLSFIPPGETRAEACDAGMNTQNCNGNDNVNSNERGSCQVPRCGDGYHNPAFEPPGSEAHPEVCDAGQNTQLCNGNDYDNDDVDDDIDKDSHGKGNCQVPWCGDGYINPNFIPPNGSRAEECEPSIAGSCPNMGMKTCDEMQCLCVPP